MVCRPAGSSATGWELISTADASGPAIRVPLGQLSERDAQRVALWTRTSEELELGTPIARQPGAEQAVWRPLSPSSDELVALQTAVGKHPAFGQQLAGALAKGSLLVGQSPQLSHAILSLARTLSTLEPGHPLAERAGALVAKLDSVRGAVQLALVAEVLALRTGYSEAIVADAAVAALKPNPSLGVTNEQALRQMQRFLADHASDGVFVAAIAQRPEVRGLVLAMLQGGASIQHAAAARAIAVTLVRPGMPTDAGALRQLCERLEALRNDREAFDKVSGSLARIADLIANEANAQPVVARLLGELSRMRKIADPVVALRLILEEGSRWKTDTAARTDGSARATFDDLIDHLGTITETLRPLISMWSACGRPAYLDKRARAANEARDRAGKRRGGAQRRPAAASRPRGQSTRQRPPGRGERGPRAGQ